ncbi:MAG: tRNA lysidine(34) synthetase TilS [Deltaproteobacteria bacterium]|nr:tRNA lysidine(34) synthetase TilS [Deltaproteobacteria bacterium]
MIYRQTADFLEELLAVTGAREVWVACSGGLDSMVLLALVRSFGQRRGVPVGVLHFNHGLRPAARADEFLVLAQAVRDYGLPLVLGQAHALRERARSRRLSLETAARQARYAFFGRFLRRRTAVIVTAHHATDQVETMLFNLMRGTGLRGLKGIPRRRGRIGRPLLTLTRACLEAFAAEHGLAFNQDESNFSPLFTRNRIRQELLPLVRKLGGPGVEERMAATGLRLAADLEIVDDRLGELEALVEKCENGGLRIERARLQACSEALKPHFLGRMLRYVGAVKQVPARVLTELSALVGRPGERREGHYHLGRGLVFGVSPEWVRLFFSASSPTEKTAVDLDFVIAGPGIYQLPGRLGRFSLNYPLPLRSVGEALSANPTAFGEQVDGDCLKFPLRLRYRRPGDRFQPLGLQGQSRKLKKFLIDQKLDRAARARLPLLVDRDEQILWVLGLRLDHRCRLRPESRQVVKLEFFPWQQDFDQWVRKQSVIPRL